MKAVKRMEPRTLELPDCLRYVLAEGITSPADVPPFDNSAMDGFALRSQDTAGAKTERPVRLRVKATVRAGDRFSLRIQEGECAKIMTGAPIPEGADSVVMIEEVDMEDRSVLIKAPVWKGDHIRPRGEDIRKSEPVLEADTQLRPQEIGVLASLGIGRVVVTRRPVVALGTTGDELVGIDEPLPPGKIRDSNRYSLHGLILETGSTPFELGIIPDNRDNMERTFRSALKKSDMLVTTGGVSMGQYDLVKDVLSAIGKVEFWRVNMKPGKPLTFGTFDGKPIFGLPGNPVSSFISFELFARPALMKMMGHQNPFRERLKATAACPMDKQRGRAEFKRGRWRREKNELLVDLTGPQGSGILTSLVKANCLICLREDRGPILAGEEVSIIPL